MLGNPPYSGHSANRLRTFDRLYILNLHGNARRKETAPDGSPDENVFDIQQGVAILIAVKRCPVPDGTQRTPNDAQGTPDASEPCVFYADVWGRREAKYEFLERHTLEMVAWNALTPCAPMYLFVPQDTSLQAEYEQGWRIPDIFPTHSVGVVTARDSLTIHWTPEDIWRTVCQLAALEPEAARAMFHLGKDVRDWSVARAQADLRQAGVPDETARKHIQPILYRPFDVRYTFYTGRSRGFHCMPRPEVMRHLLAGENVALIVGRFGAATGDKEWNIVFVSRQMVDLNIFRRGGGEVYPLYLYSEAQGSLMGGGRRENLSARFLEALAERVGGSTAPSAAHAQRRPLSFRAEGEESQAEVLRFAQNDKGRVAIANLGVSEEQVLAYIYAVLHAPAYRSRYAEFLRRDFPRIPLPPSREARVFRFVRYSAPP
ncbi:MAG: type ISP restriction/modification enzyme [Fimbriimonadales bacterium]